MEVEIYQQISKSVLIITQVADFREFLILELWIPNVSASGEVKSTDNVSSTKDDAHALETPS